MPPPSLSPTCPKCRTALPPGAPLGLCPPCLMDAAGTDSDPGMSRDPFAAPLDLDTLRRAFPQLEILAPLGAGGMGRVYKARQPNLDRIVALKVLPPEFARDPAWVERFTREARALARLNHPNIVQVYDVGQTSAAPNVPALCWLIMEYVDGVTLRQVQRTGGLSAREALALVPKLCDALQYAHEKGVLHRDIKPENILLDSAGSVKVADFGLAKLGGPNASPTLTMTGARLGTAAYMAPEQIESPQDVDHRADIYSLGVVLYELLTGGLPLGRFPAPSEKSGTDPRLDHIVFRTLEKERDRRYQAAGDVRTALEGVAAQPGAPVSPKPRDYKPVSPTAPTLISQPREGPPPLPAGAVRKAVSFTDRNRPFPASGPEAAGYGCGWLLMVPLRFALCFAPLLIPILWFQAVKEWHREGLSDFLPSSMIWVAAVTGLASWFCVRPLLGITKWPVSERVKQKAPLLLLLAIILWGGMLFYTACASYAWPTRGVAGSMTLSSNRPPVSDRTMASSDAEMDALFRRIVESEFPGELNAVLGGTGLPAAANYYAPYHNWSSSDRDNPLRKTWTVAVATESRTALNTRLMRIAEELTATLPESVRGTISVSLQSNLNAVSTWRLNLLREEHLFLLAAVMTLGGWFAGMTRGRPMIHGVAPVLLAAGAMALQVMPFSSLPGGLTIPAGERLLAESGKTKAMEMLTTMAQSTPEAEALLRWIDACRHLDRTTADQLSRQRLDDNTWERMAGFWLRSEPLVIVKELSETSREGSAVFNCILMPWNKEQDDPRHSSYFGPYNRHRPGDSSVLRITVTKEGEKWLIQQ